MAQFDFKSVGKSMNPLFTFTWLSLRSFYITKL